MRGLRGDHVAQPFRLLRGLAMRERVGDEMGHVVGIDRLGDVVVRAVLQRGDGRLHRGVAGHDDDDEIGVDLAHAALQLDAVGAAHADVDQRQVPLLLGQAGERLAGAVRGAGVVAVVAEPAAQRVAYARLVVDDENASLVVHATASTTAAAGSAMVNVVPRPTSDLTSIFPRCRSMMLRQIARPSPVPLPSSFVVTNGSKRRGRSSGGMPTPSSSTLMTTLPSAGAVTMRRLPSRGMASMAFTIRARRSCSTCPVSPRTAGRWSPSCRSGVMQPSCSLCSTSLMHCLITALTSTSVTFIGVTRAKVRRLRTISPQRRVSDSMSCSASRISASCCALSPRSIHLRSSLA